MNKKERLAEIGFKIENINGWEYLSKIKTNKGV